MITHLSFRHSIIILAVGVSFSVDGKSLKNIEHEYKYSFKTTHCSDRVIKNILKKEAKFLIDKNILSVPKLLRKKYQFKQLENYIFKDYYFDTNNDDLSENQVSYRLRYRWKNGAKHFVDSYTGYIPWAYPLRVEIQFKQYPKSEGQKGPLLYKRFNREYRFEFRDGTYPFIGEFKAPKAPWRVQDYTKIALLGSYKGHAIIPFTMLRKQFAGRPLVLINKLDLLVSRMRGHFLLKNPWGKLPNRNQAMIVSLDRFLEIDSSKVSEGHYELEIEIDRSSLANIISILERGNKGVKETTLLASVYEETKKMYTSLLLDQIIIFSKMKKSLEDQCFTKDLGNESKVNRAKKMKYEMNLNGEQ